MVTKWFNPRNRKLGWSKDDPAKTRRANALKSRWNNPIKAGRALLALSNVTTDPVTAKLAKQDADYFFKMNEKRKR